MPDPQEPTPDPAEDYAFFPSPFSLSQYTSPVTDFDGEFVTTDISLGQGKKILVVGTEERYMLMQNGTMFSTGNHPVETLLPLLHLKEAGFSLEIATQTGAPAKFEWWAFPQDDQAVSAIKADLIEQIKDPISLEKAVDNIGDYEAIFIPGGHGAMLGLPEDPHLQKALKSMMDNNKFVISLCHGPAGFLSASLNGETSPFEGYEMCVFPDAVDSGPNIDIGYLPGKLPWELGSTLKKEGITILNENITGMVHQDRNVITGDSPLAANALGKLSVQAFLDQKQNN